MSTPNFHTMSQEQCIAWYVENVGYDPVKDYPVLMLDQLRRDCAEMYTYSSCTVDAGGRGPDDPDFDPCCGVRVYGSTRGRELLARQQQPEDDAPVRPRLRI